MIQSRFSGLLFLIVLLTNIRAGTNQRAGDEPSSLVPFLVCMTFERPADEISLQSMKTEVTHDLLPVGIPIAWRIFDGVDNRFIATELVNLNFKGRCASGGRVLSRAQGPMGVTHVVRGKILPFADIDCDQIRELIGDDLAAARPAEREFLMGRAMGRVVAHELYHMTARTERHSRAGLGRPSLTPQDLLADHQSFLGSELLAMRKGVSVVLKTLDSSSTERGSIVIGQYLYKARGCSSCHGSRGQGTRAGPALRGKDTTKVVEGICGSARANRASRALDETDIDDLISFLNTLE